MENSSNDVIRSLMEEMFEIQNKSKHFVEMLTYDEDLSENLILLLLRLKLHGHMRITEVSEAFMLTPGAATNMCDKLEDLNYIERIRIKTDRRVVNVALTTKGEKRVEEIFSKLPLEKLVTISTTLAEINHLFEKIIE
ncbi:MarR family transcriptional regulator [Sporosarcina sp. FSL K6-1522]|uniref:MarR family winged helix-turn-helix transcriptional regulator n=1 Tax=Sporosarcina sp. FSL K6-1522 TaxID=2921554 RepID=UPI00315A26CF